MHNEVFAWSSSKLGSVSSKLGSVSQSVDAQRDAGEHLRRNRAAAAERDGWVPALHLRLRTDWLGQDSHNAGLYGARQHR